MKKVGIYFIDGNAIGCGYAYMTEEELKKLLTGKLVKFLKYIRHSKGDVWDEMENITTYVHPRYITDVWVYDDFEVDE